MRRTRPVDRTHRTAQTFRTFPAALALLAAAAPCDAQGERQTGSPIAALEAMDKAVLEAETFEDFLALMPVDPEAMEFIEQMTDEQKAAVLEDQKSQVGLESYVAERVAGDDAIVVAQDLSGRDDLGVRLIRMSRVEGAWQRNDDDVYLVSGVIAGSGSYAASGSVETQLEDALIQLEATTITIADYVAEHLGEGAQVAQVRLPFPADAQLRCFEAGSLPIGTVVEDDYTIHGGLIPPGAQPEEGYVFDLTGTLEVTPAEQDHFDGRFQFTAANRSGESVSVSGTLENALMPCFGTPENARR